MASKEYEKLSSRHSQIVEQEGLEAAAAFLIKEVGSSISLRNKIAREIDGNLDAIYSPCRSLVMGYTSLLRLDVREYHAPTDTVAVILAAPMVVIGFADDGRPFDLKQLASLKMDDAPPGVTPLSVVLGADRSFQFLSPSGLVDLFGAIMSSLAGRHPQRLDPVTGDDGTFGFPVFPCVGFARARLKVHQLVGVVNRAFNGSESSPGVEFEPGAFPPYESALNVTEDLDFQVVDQSPVWVPTDLALQKAFEMAVRFRVGQYKSWLSSQDESASVLHEAPINVSGDGRASVTVKVGPEDCPDFDDASFSLGFEIPDFISWRWDGTGATSEELLVGQEPL